jgi:hypothetical protein
MTKRKWPSALSVLFMTALLGGCGGGGGTVAGGGTGGTGASMGTVSGFGSVFVNGIEYETNSATRITVDGVVVPEAEHKQKLDLGMVVKVDATLSGSTWTASSIEYRSDLIGPAEVVDTVTSTITMLGKVVTINSKTLFAGWTSQDPTDGSTVAPTLADLSDNAAVKITGFPDFDGNITATRIEWDGSTIWDSSMAVEMRGKVGEVSSEIVFRFDGAAGMQVTHNDATTVSVGDYVRVVGRYDGSAITATEAVELEDRTFGREDDEFEIEGMVQHIDATRIMVLGYEIDISSAEGATGLVVGDLVEVEGEEFLNGMLVADEIEIKRLSDMELRALVTAHDSAAGTVTLLGRTFVITASTAIKDKAAFFSNLRDNETMLEVDAYMATSGDHVVTEAEFSDSANVKLEGFVEMADPNTSIVVISDIEADLSGVTTFPTSTPDGRTTGCDANDRACFVSYLDQNSQAVEVEIYGVEDNIGGAGALGVVASSVRFED